MKKKRDKNKKKISNTNKFIIFLLIMIIIFSAILYIKISYRRKLDNKEQEEISSILDNIDIPKSEINYNKSERIIKFEKLKKINNGIVGWIEIPNTKINYPICQAKDNKYYIDHTYKKTKNMSGSIFLDKDCDIRKQSKNLLIYGHRNKSGLMFEDLIKYKSKKYYEEHPIIKIITEEKESMYKIFSVFRSKVYYENQKDVFKYYKFTDPSKAEDVNNYIRNVKELSIYDTKTEAHLKDYFVTLSTCDYNTEDGRFVIVAKKIE